ncbi:MAG TPA: hypothetical protein VFM88_23860 [Vicinamibacteria bacterium]|nr:hypothetical protein [Vicinamibacteria bacterium]
MAAASLLLALPGAAQTVFEGRYGFETEYRFVDLGHTFASGPYLEALYIGVPGQNELYLGVGFQLRPATGVAFTPVVYAVFGKDNDQQGIAAGGLLSVDRSGWKVLAFAGHFFRTSGDVDDYTFVDALDLTRAIGKWEAGVSVGLFETGGDKTWLVGPTLKRNDRLGAWAFAARFGDDTEYRVIRTLVF